MAFAVPDVKHVDPLIQEVASYFDCAVTTPEYLEMVARERGADYKPVI